MGMLGQWRIQGRDPAIFLDQTDSKRAEKLFFETAPPPPPPPYLEVWIR